jgi:hypothetical protein
MQYWALSLLNILLFQSRNHKIFFDQNIIKVLIQIAPNSLIQAKYYIAEILGVLCGDRNNFPEIENYPDIVILLLQFCNHSEIDLKLSALSVIVNLVAASAKFRAVLLKNKAFPMLKDYFLGTKSAQNLRPSACRVLSVFLRHGNNYSYKKSLTSLFK